MRYLALILAVLVATQSALVIAIDSPCEAAAGAVVRCQELSCSMCSSESLQACCCGCEPLDQPAPAPLSLEFLGDSLRVLLTSFDDESEATRVDFNDDEAPFAAQLVDCSPIHLGHSHNERLAVLCLLRT